MTVGSPEKPPCRFEHTDSTMERATPYPQAGRSLNNDATITRLARFSKKEIALNAYSSLLGRGIAHKVHRLLTRDHSRRDRPAPPTGRVYHLPGLLGSGSHQGHAACQPAKNTERRLKREIHDRPQGASDACANLPERTVLSGR